MAGTAGTADGTGAAAICVPGAGRIPCGTGTAGATAAIVPLPSVFEQVPRVQVNIAGVTLKAWKSFRS